ncbi:MAG: response regulator transcription factor [Acetobacteraceae bacterium]|nr:response regulator transcription factor [Acetobacteraceae bacterium]MBV8524353.1 response regulator transcription factor [Acetobacteraceae bacterium]
MRNPEDAFDAAREADPSVRWRGRRLWQAEGSPPGRELEFLELARKLQADDDNPAAQRLPNSVHIVDDDEAVRDSLRDMLEEAGYRAQTWASGIDLLQAVERLEPGCIIVDVRMPEIDGLTLMARLRAHNIKLPIIVITGHGDVPMAVQAMKTGAIDFIEKPFAKQVIINSIRMALKPKHSSRANERP